MILFLVNKEEILRKEEVLKLSPTSISSLLELKSVDLDEKGEVVALFFQKEKEEVILLLQRKEKKWQIIFPEETIDIRDFFLRKIQYLTNINPTLKKNLEELLQTYSQQPIDIYFLRRLGFSPITLSEDPNADEQILSYLQVKELLPLSYFFPFVKEYLPKRIREELKTKYQVECPLPKEDLFLMYKNLEKDTFGDFVVKAAKNRRLDIIKCVGNSSLKMYLNAKVSAQAVNNNDFEMVDYLFSVGVLSSPDLAAARGFLDLLKKIVSYEVRPSSAAAIFSTDIRPYHLYPTTDGLNLAIDGGHLEVVRYLLDNGIQPDIKSANLAAKKGFLDLLQEFIAKNIRPNAIGFNAAIQEGHFEIAKYLLDIGISPDAKSVSLAIDKRYLDLVKRMVQMGFTFSDHYVEKLIQNKDMETIHFIIDNEIRKEHYAMIFANLAARYRNLDLLKYLASKKIYPYENVDIFIQNEELENVKQFLEIPSPHISRKKVIKYIISYDRLDIFQYLLSKDLVPTVEMVKLAIEKDSLQILQYFVSIGLASNTDLIKVVIKKDRLDLLQYFVSVGFIPNTETVDYALKNGSKNIAYYLITNRVFPTQTGVNYAIEKYWNDIIYLLDNLGFVFNNESIDHAVNYGDIEVVGFFLDKGLRPSEDVLWKLQRKMERKRMVDFLTSVGVLQ